MIYFDNAATTIRLNDFARESLDRTSKLVIGNPSSRHKIGTLARKHLDGGRERVANCINAKPKEIVFTSGGTEANNMALRGIAGWGDAVGKKHIISTKVEHHAVLNVLDSLTLREFDVTLLDVDSTGRVSAEQVENAIRPDTCLVSVMYANNEVGTIQPIEEIGRVCYEHGVYFHTDAVQAAGHIPIDVQAAHIDLLSMSGHKFHAPKGIGALYVHTDTPCPSLLFGGRQEFGLRPGTENVVGAFAMGVALKDECYRMEQRMGYVTALRDRLIEGLSEIPCSRLLGSPEYRLPGIVSFCFGGIEGESLMLMLDNADICVSAGAACSSGSLAPSHVLTAMGLDPVTARGTIRLSLSAYNTMDEVERTITEVKKQVAFLREVSPRWKAQHQGG